MRFCIGKIPVNQQFDPTQGNWTKCREPSFRIFLLLSLPIAVILVISLVSIITSFEVITPGFTIRPDEPATKIVELFAMLFGGFLGLLVLHEATHVIGHPGMGTSTDTIVGISPKHFVAYASYDGEISRNRFLFMVSLPFLLLTVVPIVGFAIWGQVNMWLAWLAVFNGLGSCFDVLVIIIVLVQVPSNAVLRNKGWDTYWRLSE